MKAGDLKDGGGGCRAGKEPKRIVIVDDHPIVRRGLAELISQEPDLVVCAQAASYADKQRPWAIGCESACLTHGYAACGSEALKRRIPLRID